ncbi:hypothetical protein [Paenibacillus illinoisensis]|uniref:hypothetical protein n=1 Tax=Paenibacillus illinoisensis TaxID=59845 RepID=UPI00301E548B
MKYVFLSVLHQLRLSTKLNKGIELYPGGRISNGLESISNVINSELLKYTAGVHSLDEFKDAVLFVKSGEFSEINSKNEMDERGNMIAFYFLREIEKFTHHLWEIKDNNVYVRDGFLVVYTNSIEDGFTYKASLSSINTLSSGEKLQSVFSREEVLLAVKRFTPFLLDEMDSGDFGGKYPRSDHFFKNNKFSRMDRAKYFTLAARASATLPMKIVSYCTALECLFTTGNSELSHRISERVAILLGDQGKKEELFKSVKRAYDYRSKIVHGSNIKGSESDLIEITVELDRIFRKLFINNYDIFNQSDQEIDNYFTKLLFQE